MQAFFHYLLQTAKTYKNDYRLKVLFGDFNVPSTPPYTLYCKIPLDKQASKE
jgi:endonuclease/exonuclease/phosphatase family metal-dependent hydrolase